MLRKRQKQEGPQSSSENSNRATGGSRDEASSADSPGLKPRPDKVKKSKKRVQSAQWKKTWLPAAAVVVAAVCMYQQQKSQLQEMLSSVTNMTTIDELIGKLPLHQLPAFNWSAALGMDAQQRIGVQMAELGYKAKHPVAIVPGFVTSGLELWQGHECAKKYFRQRMWGTLTMVQTFLNDKECWFRHLMMHPITGLDPDGIKLRSVEGLEAVDYFVQGYWVFNKMIEALADVGYTSNQLACMSYDWRMAAPGAEVRDGYFSRMRTIVELLHGLHEEKVVLVAHSMGDITVRNFLAWMEVQQPGWTAAHIHAFINIAGTSLGLPKAATALLSGELRDTTHLGPLAYFLAENMVPREMRAMLWRTWGALVQMLPTGGEAVWGNATWAPDDDESILAAGRTVGAMITAGPAGQEVMNNDELDKNSSATQQADNFLAMLRSLVATRSPQDPKTLNQVDHMTVVDVLKLLPKVLEPIFATQAHNWAGQPDTVYPPPVSDSSHTGLQCCGSSCSPLVSTPPSSPTLLPPPHCAIRARQWFQTVDPVRQPLPIAPSMKLFCMYGVGIPTERGYHYLHYKPEAGESNATKEAVGTEWRINKAVTDLPTGLDRGVQMTDGDGTVPLLSLGLMCRKGWRTHKLNPANISVVSREYIHNPETSLLDPRGGPLVADHVSILGNDHVLRDVIRVAAGMDEELQDIIHSNIESIAARIHFDSI